MDIEEISRPLTRAETILLKKLRSKIELALKRRFRIRTFIIAILSGSLFTYIANLINGGFFSVVFGTLAVFCFCFVVFAPYELYKNYKKAIQQLKEVDAFLAANQLKVTPVDALQIALAEEYEDEGDLFIIEYKKDHILYLWDHDYEFGKRFPCLKFELYEKAFSKLIYRQLHSLSEKIDPVLIDRKNKWAYMGKIGAPAHLATEEINFNTLVARYDKIDSSEEHK